MRIDTNKFIKRMPWVMVAMGTFILVLTTIWKPENLEDVLSSIFVFYGCAIILFVSQFVMNRKMKKLENRYSKKNQRYAKRG